MLLNAVHRLAPALVMLQIFVPVYDVAGAQEMSSVLWNAPDGEQASPIKVPRLCVRLSAGHQAVPAMHKSRRCCMRRPFLLTGLHLLELPRVHPGPPAEERL